MRQALRTAEEASDDDNFVSDVTPSGNMLTISYSANTGTSSRMAAIRLSTTPVASSISRTLSVTQRSSASPTIALTTAPAELTGLAAGGGTIEVTIAIDGSASGWEATETDEADFISLSATSGVGSGSLTIT